MTPETKEAPEMTPERQAMHVSQMMHSMGWQIMVHHWNVSRELIIQDGKKARAEEKKISNWAKLDGFDGAVLLAEKLVRAGTTGPGEGNDDAGPEEG